MEAVLVRVPTVWLSLGGQANLPWTAGLHIKIWPSDPASLVTPVKKLHVWLFGQGLGKWSSNKSKGIMPSWDTWMKYWPNFGQKEKGLRLLKSPFLYLQHFQNLLGMGENFNAVPGYFSFIFYWEIEGSFSVTF